MTYPSLNQAAEDLSWCAQIPHTIDQIIGIWQEQQSADRSRQFRHGASNDEMVEAIKAQSFDGVGSAGTGGHPDPTADAALYGEPDAVEDIDDATPSSIDATIDMIWSACVELADLAGTRRPDRNSDRAERIRECVVAIHRFEGKLEQSDHVDLVVRSHITDPASWLRIKAEGIWLASKGETLQPAVQKTIAECTCCSKWRTGTIASERGLCSECRGFQQREHALPIEGIVKRWEYGQAATPGQIMEAKAAAKARLRKVKTA